MHTLGRSLEMWLETLFAHVLLHLAAYQCGPIWLVTYGGRWVLNFNTGVWIAGSHIVGASGGPKEATKGSCKLGFFKKAKNA